MLEKDNRVFAAGKAKKSPGEKLRGFPARLPKASQALATDCFLLSFQKSSIGEAMNIDE